MHRWITVIFTFLCVHAGVMTARADTPPVWVPLSTLASTDWARAFVFENIQSENGDVIAVSVAGEWGLLVPDGRWVLPPKYGSAPIFQEGLALVREFGSAWGYIDRTGKYVIPSRFQSAGTFNTGLAPVEEKGKWGYIDRTGKFVIPPRFDWAQSFDGERGTVRLNGVNGFVDRQGRFVPDAQVDETRRQGEVPHVERQTAADGYVLVSRRWSDGRQSSVLLDSHGQPVKLPPREGWMQSYHGNGLAQWWTGKSNLILDIRNNRELLRGYSVHGASGNFLIVSNDDALKPQMGILGPTGWVVRPRDHAIDILSDRYFSVRDKGLVGWLDREGKVVVSPRFASVSPFQRGIAVASDGCRHGLVNERGEWVVQPEFDNIYPGGAGGLSTAIKFGQYGVMDAAGRWLTPTRPQPNVEMWRTRQPVGGWGFIDPAGREVIPAVFHAASDFQDDSAMLSLGEHQTGLISRRGQWLLPPVFDSAEPFRGEVTHVVENFETPAVFDRNCRKVAVEAVEPAEQRINFTPADGGPPVVENPAVLLGSPTEPDWTMQAQNGRIGFVDAQGNWKVPPRFEDAGVFAENLAPVKSGGYWGYIDRQGKLVIPARFDEARAFSQGYAAVLKDTVWRFTDPRGRFLTPYPPPLKGNKITPPAEITFEDVRNFSEDRAAVKVAGKWGYLDRKGAWMVPPIYNDAYDFDGGLARIQAENGIDQDQGAQPPRPEKPGIITYAQVIQEGKLAWLRWGTTHALMNQKGEVLIPTGLKPRKTP